MKIVPSNNHEPLCEHILSLSQRNHLTDTQKQHACTNTRQRTLCQGHAHKFKCTQTYQMGECFGGFTIAHLSAKLKMVIDPWNMNNQQCFSLSCAGEHKETFWCKKESRKQKQLELYLMLIPSCTEA